MNSIKAFIDIFIMLVPLLILAGLIDCWLPPTVIEQTLGKNSGPKGILTAILFGALAAGPLFTAFPIAKSFSEKGARPANVVLFLNSWGSIKFVMLLMESSFLGWKFSVLRLGLTLPFIVVIGFIVEHFSKTKTRRV